MKKKYLLPLICCFTLISTSTIAATLMDFNTVIASTTIAAAQPVPNPAPLLILGLILLFVVALTSNKGKQNYI